MIALDPEIANLADEAGPPPSPIAKWFEGSGISPDEFFARLADMQLAAAARMVSGYMASERRKRLARWRAYCEGAVRPPSRPTADERCKARAAAWGF